jgi:hypothetical protein
VVLADEDPLGAQHERINTSLATQVFLRGSGLSEGESARHRHASGFQGQEEICELTGSNLNRRDAARTDEFLTPGLYTAWSPQPLRVSSSDVKFAAQDKSAALVSNCRSLATPVVSCRHAWRTEALGSGLNPCEGFLKIYVLVLLPPGHGCRSSLGHLLCTSVSASVLAVWVSLCAGGLTLCTLLGCELSCHFCAFQSKSLAEDDFSDAFIRVEQIVKDYQGL